MMVGRLIGSAITKRMRGSLLILICAAGAIVGLIFLALAWNVNVAIAAAVICGLCYAPIFPTAAGIASTYFPGNFRHHLWGAHGLWFRRQHDLAGCYRLCGQERSGTHGHLADRGERIPVVHGAKHFRSPGAGSRRRNRASGEVRITTARCLQAGMLKQDSALCYGACGSGVWQSPATLRRACYSGDRCFSAD